MIPGAAKGSGCGGCGTCAKRGLEAAARVAAGRAAAAGALDWSRAATGSSQVRAIKGGPGGGWSWFSKLIMWRMAAGRHRLVSGFPAGAGRAGPGR